MRFTLLIAALVLLSTASHAAEKGPKYDLTYLDPKCQKLLEAVKANFGVVIPLQVTNNNLENPALESADRLISMPSTVFHEMREDFHANWNYFNNSGSLHLTIINANASAKMYGTKPRSEADDVVISLATGTKEHCFDNELTNAQLEELPPDIASQVSRGKTQHP